jgi:hypothetical protein
MSCSKNERGFDMTCTWHRARINAQKAAAKGQDLEIAVVIGAPIIDDPQPEQLPMGMLKNQQSIQQPKRDRRHHEKVHRGDAVGMILKKCLPTLWGWLWRQPVGRCRHVQSSTCGNTSRLHRPPIREKIGQLYALGTSALANCAPCSDQCRTLGRAAECSDLGRICTGPASSIIEEAPEHP